MSTVTTYYGEIASTTYAAEGVIYDQTGNPLLGATIQLVINKTGKPITNPFLLENATYQAWTSENPYDIAVLFKAPGYIDQKIQIQTLINYPDVTMKKGSNAIIEPWMIILVMSAVVILQKRKKKVGAFQSSDVMTIFLLIGGVLAFNIIKQILEKLGLGSDKNVTDELSNPNSEWKPTYWQQFTVFSYAITESTAKQYAKRIHDAFSVIQDDYNSIYSVFAQMKTKANVSFLAWVFEREYDEDLLTFLTDGGGVLPWDGLSTSHMNTLINLVNKLPNS